MLFLIGFRYLLETLNGEISLEIHTSLVPLSDLELLFLESPAETREAKATRVDSGVLQIGTETLKELMVEAARTAQLERERDREETKELILAMAKQG